MSELCATVLECLPGFRADKDDRQGKYYSFYDLSPVGDLIESQWRVLDTGTRCGSVVAKLGESRGQ